MIIRRLPILFFATLLLWGCGGDRSPKNAAEECDRLLAEAHRNAQSRNTRPRRNMPCRPRNWP